MGSTCFTPYPQDPIPGWKMRKIRKLNNQQVPLLGIKSAVFPCFLIYMWNSWSFSVSKLNLFPDTQLCGHTEDQRIKPGPIYWRHRVTGCYGMEDSYLVGSTLHKCGLGIFHPVDWQYRSWFHQLSPPGSGFGATVAETSPWMPWAQHHCQCKS
jgi:hypothetical protein